MKDAEVMGVLLLLLMVVLPLFATFSDVMRRRYPRTPPMIALGYLRHLLVIAVPTLVGLAIALLAFAIYPAGLVLQLILGVDLLARSLSGASNTLPLTCAWTGIPASVCLPSALALHLGHLVVAWLGLRYGLWLLGRLGEGLRAARDSLDAALGLRD